eukprot:TRINITY_DN396_c0_g1_i1.p1 TRINITY_DN396_c0_g1~~TRINITY_DN396_c0_g1_i1.p1  ORF type:complete len:156 (-),score=37.32 TRINITY_DN396_c0_g1_i1:2-424(-)
MYDKDAVYINLRDHQVNFTEPTEEGVKKSEGEGEALVKELQKVSTTMSHEMNDNLSLRVFSNSRPLGHRERVTTEVNEEKTDPKDRTRRRVEFDKNDEQKSLPSFTKMQLKEISTKQSLQNIVYLTSHGRSSETAKAHRG